MFGKKLDLEKKLIASLTKSQSAHTHGPISPFSAEFQNGTKRVNKTVWSLP